MSVLSLFDKAAVFEALDASQARIEFDLKGIVLDANRNFCAALGYELKEIVGQHHRIFVPPAEAASPAYSAFWAQLAAGKYDKRQYKRLTKSGQEIWIEASYNPVFKRERPYKVIKYATDITQLKVQALDDARKLGAVSRSQAIIEFLPDGTIITANENFCNALGYSLSEIAGKHHSMFCDKVYASSEAYRQFWPALAEGRFSAGEFVRYGKGGKEIWIQAAYNPILDDNGVVYKVVKIATDVSERMAALAALGTGLRAMKEGDLTFALNSPVVPSMETVRRDFNEAIEGMRSAIISVEQNAQSIAASSDELRETTNDLSKRTEQQAASVEETAAALEQITTTISDSAKRAGEAGRLVAASKDFAERSGKIVEDAMSAMNAIATSSSEIGNIISVIDDIAFQTNLLALNAGVEAARAGDAGKGFAVVAQEVRELAQRSAKAAKEIDAIIKLSRSQVGTGVELVNKTGSVLGSIVSQVGDVATNVSAIIEAAREQAIGLSEINQAVNAIDQGTQQNAAMVEESTANSHKLAQDAQVLFDLCSRFKTAMQQGNRAAAYDKPTLVARRGEAKPSVSPSRSALAVAKDEWEEF